MKILLVLIAKIIRRAACAEFNHNIKKYTNISGGAILGNKSTLIGPPENFVVGNYSYINKGHLSCGPSSKVIIGSGCAIGYNVSIKALTHSLSKPTNNAQGKIKHEEKDIIIGDDCWIGDNVFIREGVVLGNKTIVGANSVVTRSFLGPGQIIAGIPARFIRDVE